MVIAERQRSSGVDEIDGKNSRQTGQRQQDPQHRNNDEAAFAIFGPAITAHDHLPASRLDAFRIVPSAAGPASQLFSAWSHMPSAGAEMWMTAIREIGSVRPVTPSRTVTSTAAGNVSKSRQEGFQIRSLPA